MDIIPIDRLTEEYNLKLRIMRLTMGGIDLNPNVFGTHRDDHYVFFLIEQGLAKLMIEGEDLSIKAGEIYYILPGQVHQRINYQMAQGWFLALEAGLIPKDFSSTLETIHGLQDRLQLPPDLFKQCITLLNMIEQRMLSTGHMVFQTRTTITLLQSLVGIIAGGYSEKDDSTLFSSRANELTYRFKKLVNENFIQKKKPAEYAPMLNVTVNYLNQAVKASTGYPVSYWINEAVVAEAKRLLIYTTLDAKEIAHKIGYKDHTYFFKIFKKVEGLSPLSYRSQKSV